jgi:hypothetical protein
MRTLVAMLALTCAVCGSSSAQTLHLMTPTMTADPPSQLSAASGSQPTVEMKVSAIPKTATGDYVGDGVSILFDVPTNASMLHLSASSAQTLNGAATIQIRGTGTAGAVTLRARWMFSMTHIAPPATITINLVADDCAKTTNTPHPIHFSRPLANPCTIKWKSSSSFSGSIMSAMASWQSTGRVKFIHDPDNANLEFRSEECDPMQPPGFGAAKVFDAGWIQFNRYYIAGNPKSTTCASEYPPFDMAYAHWVAVHEIGHFILFNHNTVDYASVMFEKVKGYFICGSSGPTADETTPLAEEYPSTCP